MTCCIVSINWILAENTWVETTCIILAKLLLAIVFYLLLTSELKLSLMESVLVALEQELLRAWLRLGPIVIGIGPSRLSLSEPLRENLLLHLDMVSIENLVRLVALALGHRAGLRLILVMVDRRRRLLPKVIVEEAPWRRRLGVVVLGAVIKLVLEFLVATAVPPAWRPLPWLLTEATRGRALPFEGRLFGSVVVVLLLPIGNLGA